MANALQAIETVYAGIKFRSKLESRWAILFDCLSVKWKYEPALQIINGVGYLPDFFLPDYDTFVEIKPALHGDRIEKPIALATKHNTAVLVGRPFANLQTWFGCPGIESRIYNSHLGLCRRCGKFMVCASVNGVAFQMLYDKGHCKHQFVLNPDVTAWNHAFVQTQSERATTDQCKPFPVDLETLKRI